MCELVKYKQIHREASVWTLLEAEYPCLLGALAGFALISLLEADAEDEASLSVVMSTAAAGSLGRIGIFGNNTLGSVAEVVEGLGDDDASLLACF